MTDQQRAVRRPPSDGWVTSVHGTATGEALGSGFLVDERRVLTCAHVARPAGRPDGDLWVAFPKLPELMTRRIKVDRVVLPEPEYQATQPDVAVLVLAEPAPGYAAARLRRPTPDDLVGRTWWSFGFPNGRVLGNSADGGIGESLGFGWVRLDTASRYPVRPGFSGAALWSPEYDAVVGMIGQANGENGDAQAITLWMADLCLPDQKLGRLTDWSAEAAGESALAAWGWSLDRDPEARRHWRPRARGVSTDAERGFRFRGRTAALGAIVDWLGGGAERQALVVTGSPGVGKSAVLGRIVTTADVGIAAALPARDNAVRAPLGSIACAVHAKGKTALGVAEEIARAASAALPALPQDLAPALRDALTGRQQCSFNVVIDALDEAASPLEARAVITAVILPLVETCSDLGVRVVVGSRRRDNGGGLLTAFGPAKQEIDLDSTEFFAEADLAAYALATLQLVGDERPGNPYQDERVAGPVAARIAALSEQNFLIAGLVARTHGMADRVAIAPEDVAFTPTVDAALREYLKLLPPVSGISAWDALTALAYAEPPGFPLTIWQVGIGALYGVEPSEEALRAFARSSAANFLVETSDAGEGRLYRLFHQALDDTLLGARADLDATTGDERAIARALRSRGRSLGWDRSPVYLRRALPGHAARGGVLDDLLTDDAYLLHTDLSRLIPLASHGSSALAVARAKLLRRTPRAISTTAHTRAAMFTVTEVREDLVRGDFAAATADIPYTAQWATVAPQDGEAVLEGHHSDVLSVCEVPADGRSLLASLDESGIRIWDPASGDLMNSMFSQGERLITACAVPTSGGPLLATANGDGSIRLWDPLTGRRLHALNGHDGEVRHLCAVRSAGRHLLVSAGKDKTVRLWEPVTGRQLRILPNSSGPLVPLSGIVEDGEGEVLLTGRDGSARRWRADPDVEQPARTFESNRMSSDALCALTDRGTSRIVCGRGSKIEMWDASSGGHLGVRMSPGGRVVEVCAIPVSEKQNLIATADTHGNVLLWDLYSSDPIATLQGHLSTVRSLCTVQVNGRAMLASGSADRTVRIWDPAATSLMRRDAEQSILVKTLCTTEVDGRTVLAHASAAHTSRCSSPIDGHRVSTNYGGPPGVLMLCRSEIDGRAVLAGATQRSNGVWLWHPESSKAMRLLMGSMDPVTGLCALRAGARQLIAVGYANGTVRIWYPQTDETLHVLKHHTVAVEALCEVRGTDLLLAGGAADGTVRLWNVADGAPLPTLTGHRGPVGSLCALPGEDAVLLASGSADRTVRLWDPFSGTELHTLPGHGAPVTALHPVQLGHRSLLASASTDRTVRIWDPLDARCLAEIPVYSPAHALTTAEGNVVVGLSDGLLALRLNPGLLKGGWRHRSS